MISMLSEKKLVKKGLIPLFTATIFLAFLYITHSEPFQIVLFLLTLLFSIIFTMFSTYIYLNNKYSNEKFEIQKELNQANKNIAAEQAKCQELANALKEFNYLMQGKANRLP